VERTFAPLHNRRRVLIRTDRRDDIHERGGALVVRGEAGIGAIM
jgi:hypothetical protein